MKRPLDFQFSYLVISSSRANYLKNVAANEVVNCWTNKKKVLHSGLIRFYENWYYADNLSRKPSKDFIIIRYFPEKSELILYLFPEYYPKKPFEFSRRIVFEVTLKEKAT